MKNLLIIIFLMSLSQILNAQVRDNLVTPLEYNQISFQVATIQQLYDSKGDKDKIISYFGSPLSQKNGNFRLSLTYQNNLIVINTELKRITRLEINDASWTIKIKGNIFKVGDSLSKFQQLFGSSLKVIVPPNNPNKKFIGFSYSNNDFDSITIYLNPQTNKVKQILYFVIP
ncbi:MAG: hypothetical protein GW823_10260 [Bacteroidetes bacterium]|nr:hypothetical protein [Bacteroidota bacterium]